MVDWLAGVAERLTSIRCCTSPERRGRRTYNPVRQEFFVLSTGKHFPVRVAIIFHEF